MILLFALRYYFKWVNDKATHPLFTMVTSAGARSSSKAKFTQGTNEQTTEIGGICHLRSQHTGGKNLNEKALYCR